MSSSVVAKATRQRTETKTIIQFEAFRHMHDSTPNDVSRCAMQLRSLFLTIKSVKFQSLENAVHRLMWNSYESNRSTPKRSSWFVCLKANLTYRLIASVINPKFTFVVEIRKMKQFLVDLFSSQWILCTLSSLPASSLPLSSDEIRFHCFDFKLNCHRPQNAETTAIDDRIVQLMSSLPSQQKR